MAVRFRKKVSFNTHDCKVVEGERIEVTLGLNKRCDMALNGVLRFGATGVSVSNLTSHLNDRFNCEYSVGDVSNAIKKLASQGMVTRRGHGKDAIIRGTRNALARWRALEKVKV